MVASSFYAPESSRDNVNVTECCDGTVAYCCNNKCQGEAKAFIEKAMLRELISQVSYATQDNGLLSIKAQNKLQLKDHIDSEKYI